MSPHTDAGALLRDITMQDVRLVCGEGKLENRHVLNAANVIMKRRMERAELLCQAASQGSQNCDCGFSGEICSTNPCMRKKLATSGLVPDAKYPNVGKSQTESAPGLSASHNTGERLPSSDAAGLGADTTAQAQQDGAHNALDNSQSLLVMLLHLGEAYQAATIGRCPSGIATAEWESEGLTKLLTDQIVENRSALGASPVPSAECK